MIVHDILQDGRGFMWFATAGGLSRYDGYDFKHYHHVPSDPNSLANNLVTGLIEDRSGNIWITSGGGLNKLDPITDKISTYTLPNGAPLSSWRAFCDRDGIIWIATLGFGLVRFDLKGLSRPLSILLLILTSRNRSPTTS